MKQTIELPFWTKLSDGNHKCLKTTTARYTNEVRRVCLNVYINNAGQRHV